MHRTKPLIPLVFSGLLLALGLHTAATRSLAQPAPVAAPVGAEEDKSLKIPVNEARIFQPVSKQIITSAVTDQKTIIRIEEVAVGKGTDPYYLRITGLAPGFAEIIITDKQGGKELVRVHVVSVDDELFALEKSKLDAKRTILLEMIRKAVPTARVDVIVGLQRNKVTNDSIILTGTVVLYGDVFEAESVQIILDLANVVFAGNANPGQRGQNQPVVPGAGSNTTITPSPIAGYNQAGGINVPVGNRISVINNLRLVGVQQVELSVTVAVVDRSKARNMGFNWFDNRVDSFLTSFISPVATATTLATAIAGGAATGASSPGNFSFGLVKNGNGFNGVLQALCTETVAKILAEPKVVTLSGRPANFISGGQTPIFSSSTGGSSITYLQFGTVINFVPIVLGNGKIHLEVAANVSDVTSTANVGSGGSFGSAPVLSTKGAQVAVQMEDGQTLAIGGLIQNKVNASTSKVPVLGEIPFIGLFFRQTTYTESEEELMILVTPRLVDPMSCTQQPKYLPGRETRVADDYELFLEGILEAPRGQRNVTLLHPHQYVASHKLEGANPGFPCNDESRRCGSGNCGNGSCGVGGCSTGNCGGGSPTIQSGLGAPASVMPDQKMPSGPAEFKALPPGTSPVPLPPVRPMTMNNNFAPVQDVVMRPGVNPQMVTLPTTVPVNSGNSPFQPMQPMTSGGLRPVEMTAPPAGGATLGAAIESR